MGKLQSERGVYSYRVATVGGVQVPDIEDALMAVYEECGRPALRVDILYTLSYRPSMRAFADSLAGAGIAVSWSRAMVSAYEVRLYPTDPHTKLSPPLSQPLTEDERRAHDASLLREVPDEGGGEGPEAGPGPGPGDSEASGEGDVPDVRDQPTSDGEDGSGVAAPAVSEAPVTPPDEALPTALAVTGASAEVDWEDLARSYAAGGLSTRQISKALEAEHGVEVSHMTISRRLARGVFS